MTKKRIKRPVVNVPKERDDAAGFLSSLAEAQREIDQIEATLNKAVEKLTAQAMKAAKPYQEKKAQLVEGLFVFALGNREELTEGGKHKTVKLPTGSLSWRLTPPKVNITSKEKVLKALKRLGLKRFIRIQEEIDKEAMLREPEEVKKVTGASITQQEEFVVKPLELKVEVVAEKKTKIKVA